MIKNICDDKTDERIDKIAKLYYGEDANKDENEAEKLKSNKYEDLKSYNISDNFDERIKYIAAELQFYTLYRSSPMNMYKCGDKFKYPMIPTDIRNTLMDAIIYDVDHVGAISPSAAVFSDINWIRYNVSRSDIDKLMNDVDESRIVNYACDYEVCAIIANYLHTNNNFLYLKICNAVFDVICTVYGNRNYFKSHIPYNMNSYISVVYHMITILSSINDVDNYNYLMRLTEFDRPRLEYGGNADSRLFYKLYKSINLVDDPFMDFHDSRSDEELLERLRGEFVRALPNLCMIYNLTENKK